MLHVVIMLAMKKLYDVVKISKQNGVRCILHLMILWKREISSSEIKMDQYVSFIGAHPSCINDPCENFGKGYSESNEFIFPQK